MDLNAILNKAIQNLQEDDDMMEVLDYDNQETEDVVALLFS